MGIVIDSLFPPEETRRILTWLPFWLQTLKPNFVRIEITSFPESRLSLGTDGIHLECHNDWSTRVEPEFFEIFPFQVDREGLAEIHQGFVHRLALRDDGQMSRFGNKPTFVSRIDAHLNGTMHGNHLQSTSIPLW